MQSLILNEISILFSGLKVEFVSKGSFLGMNLFFIAKDVSNRGKVESKFEAKNWILSMKFFTVLDCHRLELRCVAKEHKNLAKQDED